MIRRFGYWPCLIILAIIALALRLIGLDWDKGLYLHPDERFMVWVTTDLRWPANIGQYFDSATSPLNPYNTSHDSFIYGTFPSFLVKAIAGIFGMDSYGQLHLVGRATNAVFDTGTVILTALFARRFFNDRASILAGLLLAFTPLFIQSAHFFTVDTISVFFTIAAYACVLRSWDRQSIGWMALAGVMIGLAGASKPNYLIALAFLALPALERIRQRGWRSLFYSPDTPRYSVIAASLLGGFVSFVTFRIAQPYAFAGPHWWNIQLNQEWLDDLAYWRAVQTGLVDMKPSIQWIDRTPVVYILQNMVLWGMGVALGVMALVALGAAIWRLGRSPIWPSWWWLGIAGWCIGSIAVYGSGIAQNQRYLMHIYPFLIILVAGFLIELQGRLHRKWIAQVLITGVALYTVFFGLAFDSLYVRPITRIEASEWIYENIPPGSTLSNEYWDDALPMPLPGEDRSAYIGMTLDLYADEAGSNSKVVTLVGQLSQVDYIVLSSNRVIDSVVRQPERYPVAVRYYEMLINGELGFEPVAHFAQGPELLGIEWDDRTAEESLTVYEHPEVRIFVKTDAYDAQFVHDQLNAAWGYGGFHYIPGDPSPDQMLMSDEAIAEQNELGSWSDQVDDGWLQSYPLLAWWIGLQVVGLAAWPITWRAFRNLPDMGLMLAKAIGLLGMSAITIALVSWRGLYFDKGTIALSLLLLLAVGFATHRCIWDEFRYKLRRQWRFILAGELLFLGIFLAMALLRSWERILPDHNLMQLTGIMRSVTLPPMDPWLSGGVLHTYWASILPWAALGRMLALEPVVVANLTVIGVIAVLAGVVWSLVSSISRSWIGVITVIALVFGSSLSFAAGFAPIATASSIDLPLLSTLLIAATLIHAFICQPKQRWTRFLVIAAIFGAQAVSAEWGILVAIILVAIGLAIDGFGSRADSRTDTGFGIRSGDAASSPDPAGHADPPLRVGTSGGELLCTSSWDAMNPWWPDVRGFALKLIGIIAVGLALWYPAYAAHTATGRSLTSPELWSLDVLQTDLGMVLLMTVMIVVGIGAVNVLATLLEEGTPGIIVTGITVASVIALFVLAWRFDSALVLIMLISLMAITAAWHWLGDSALLWSSGLILLACFVLASAQTRSFHADPGGVSATQQLIPLAWMLMVVGLGIACARMIPSLKSDAKLAVIPAVALITIAMIIPTYEDIFSNEHERVSMAHLAIIAPKSELAAASWLQNNTTGSPVILTSDGSGPQSVGTISALTGLPTVLGSNPVERTIRPGWNRMVEERSIDVTTIYTGVHDWTLVSPLISQYDVRYIIVGNEERSRFGPLDNSFAAAVAEGHLHLVFEYEDIAIYQVVTDH